MAFVSGKRWDDGPAVESAPASNGLARFVRWTAISGAGIAFAAWSVATIASLYAVEAPPGLAPLFSRNALMTGTAGPANHLFEASLSQAWPAGVDSRKAERTWAEQARLLHHGCDGGCPGLAPVAGEMTAPLVQAASAGIENGVAQSSKSARPMRFERVVMQAALSHDKIMAAFARSGMAVAHAATPANGQLAFAGAAAVDVTEASTSLDDQGPALARFGREDAVPMPAPIRFGQQEAEAEGSTVLAFALSEPLEASEELPSPLDAALPASLALSPDDSSDGALAEPDDEIAPDDAPLPARRAAPNDKKPPAAQQNQRRAPAARQDSSPRAVARAEPGRPAMGARSQSPRAAEMLAYARPDNPVEEKGRGAFSNLFTTPSKKAGVAVYDISAGTVYMPDGQRLEAHSGLGGMVDNPSFVHKKNVGPTPPNTYNLVMRESRFHGVEAIRLIPTDGKNKYGRDGLLAHTYMLRGGRAESNGCVVFKDYNQFLKAFKKGKITRLVVVPGRSGRTAPGTRVASNGGDA